MAKDDGFRSEYRYRVWFWELVDGDTIRVTLDLGFNLHLRIVLRLADIDTPERRVGAGKAVADVVWRWLMGVGKRLEVVSLRWDKYGGRVDGEIWNERGEELGSWLVEQGLARRTKVGRWKWTGEELVEVEKYAKKLLEGDSL